MDRLSALIVLACVLGVGCDQGQDAKPLPSRSESGKVGSAQGATTEAFCDFHKTDDSGPLFQVPAVGEVKVTGPAKGNWMWLNVWATWCKPCVEEMPRIASWQKKLPHVDLAFVSIDESDADVAAFQQAHADAPRTARLADSKTQSDWFKQLGLDGNPPIPIHVFVSPTGHVRCARAGGVREQDYAVIQKLLAE
jgi:thiol-disulfide isomerase/thioredoxin